MKNLPAVLIVAKNKIDSLDPWIVLLEITWSDSTKTYIAHNTSDISFGGQTYISFPFQIEIPAIGKGEQIPTWTLRVSNVTRALQSTIEALSGGVGATVVITFVDANHLTENYSELQFTTEVLATNANAQWVTFTLGGQNLLRQRFPQYQYIANHCKWKYKEIDCAYQGTLTTCKRTLDDCKLHINNAGSLNGKPNTPRFGGHIGLFGGGIRVV